MHEPGPVRQLYQGVLQVGIAYYQITRGNGRGALKMLLRSIQWLAPLPDVCQGINVAQLRADAAAVRAELERVGEDGIDHSTGVCSSRCCWWGKYRRKRARRGGLYGRPYEQLVG